MKKEKFEPGVNNMSVRLSYEPSACNIHDSGLDPVEVVRDPSFEPGVNNSFRRIVVDKGAKN